MATNETRITGHLPNLTLEIVHRRDPDGMAEHMSIHVSATPSFRAAENLLLGALPQMGGSHPLALWSAMTQAMLAPWTTMLAPWNSMMGSANPWLSTLTDRKPR